MKYKLLEEKQENETLEDASKRYWDYHLSRNKSIIIDLFYGQLKSTIRCRFCQKEYISFEPFSNILLPIPPLESKEKYHIMNSDNNNSLSIAGTENCKISLTEKKNIELYECFEYFCKIEELNNWFCKKCQNFGIADKQLEVYIPPKNLVIQFRRFKIINEGSFNENIQKISTTVNFPINNLDLSGLMSSEKVKDVKNYELYAVSRHSGGIFSGHYTTVAKKHDNWFLFNDSFVDQIQENQIVSSAAYLLFYRMKE